MLDKLKVIDNIKLLAKMKKILLSEVEKAGGVTPGYLARLAFDINKFREEHKEGEKERQLPPTDVIEKIAVKLGITIDALINIDFSQVKDAEGSVILFFDSLKKLTNRNTLIWTEDDIWTIWDAKYPLMRTRKEKVLDKETGEETGEERDALYYYSRFLNKEMDLYGPVYRLSSRGKVFLLLECREEVAGYMDQVYEYYYEFYALENNKVLQVAYAKEAIYETDEPTPMFKAMNELYAAAKKSADINPNGDDIIKMIDEFMNVFKIDDKEGDD